MTTEFYKSYNNKQTEFNTSFSHNDLRTPIVIPHCYNGEPMKEIRSELCRYALIPGDLATIDITNGDPVTQAKTYPITFANLNACRIRVLVVKSFDCDKLEKQFTIKADLSQANSYIAVLEKLVKSMNSFDFVEEISEDVQVNNDLQFGLQPVLPQAPPVEHYSSVFAVNVDTNNKTKLKLQKIYPRANADADPENFTDYYMAGKKYFKLRPLIIVTTDKPFATLVPLHMASEMLGSKFWTTLGKTLSAKDLHNLGDAARNRQKNERLFYFMPVFFSMIFNNFHSAQVALQFSQYYNARKDTFMARCIRGNPRMKQIFDSFCLTYYLNIVDNVRNISEANFACLYGLQDLTSVGDGVVFFFKAVFLKMRILNHSTADIDTSFFGRLHARGYGIIYDYLDYRYSYGDHIFKPNRLHQDLDKSMYCPITMHKLSYVVFKRMSGTSSPAILVTSFDSNDRELAHFWLKYELNFSTRYANSIAMYLMNDEFCKVDSYMDADGKCGPFVNNHKCVCLNHDFGVIESAGFDANDKTIFDFAYYVSHVIDINMDDQKTTQQYAIAEQEREHVHLTFYNDNFMKNFVCSAAGVAVSTMLLKIGQRQNKTLLITDDGNCFPIELSYTWTLDQQFYYTFLADGANGYNETHWDYDYCFKQLQECFRIIDLERVRVNNVKNFKTAFRTLCGAAQNAVAASMPHISAVKAMLDFSNPPSLVGTQKKLMLPNNKIQQLYQIYKNAVEATIATQTVNARLPNYVQEVAGLRLDQIDF